MSESADLPLEALADPACLKLVKEYCYLATRSHLSEADADRLYQLLQQAETDGQLDFWIHEADHFLDHALGLSSETQVYASVNANLQSQLRELLDTAPADEESSALIQELEEGIAQGTREVQQRLKQRGYDPGPIDGVQGPRTQAALSQFQQAKGRPSGTARLDPL